MRGLAIKICITACATHVLWWMPGLLTTCSGFLWSRGEKIVPGIPGACTIRNFTYLTRGPWSQFFVHFGTSDSRCEPKTLPNLLRFKSPLMRVDLQISANNTWRFKSPHHMSRSLCLPTFGSLDTILTSAKLPNYKTLLLIWFNWYWDMDALSRPLFMWRAIIHSCLNINGGLTEWIYGVNAW